MKKQNIPDKGPQIVWREERRMLTLTGEPVLEVSLAWPEWEGGRAGRVFDRYYARLVKLWRRRWERESYLCACADLAQQRERSRPFTPWTASLTGRVGLDDGELLSLAMTAREVRGDGRALEYRWGDTWRWSDGAPVPLRELYRGEKRWRGRLRRELEEAAGESRRAGVYLDQYAERNLRRWFSPQRFFLTPEGLDLCYPQCTLAPAVEGTPVFHLPLPPGVKPPEEKKEA